MDVADSGISVLDTGLEGIAESGDSEDAASVGDYAGVGLAGTGVEDLTVRGKFEAGDEAVGDYRAGIAFGSEDHAGGGFRVPAEEVWREGTAGGGEKGFGPVAIEAHHEGLGLWISEADVEFEDAGTVGGHHDAGVEEAGELGGSNDGEDDSFQDGRALGLVEDAGVGEGSHAAGVGAFVVIEDAFVVLRGFEGDSRFGVAKCDEADFFADEEFFEDEGAGELGEGFFGFGVVLGDNDAFAGGEAVRLEDEREVEVGKRGAGLFGGVYSLEAGGGDA